MAKKNYTVVLDAERSTEERILVEYIESLDRTQRQRKLREFLQIGLRMNNDDELKYALISVLLEKSSADSIYELIEKAGAISSNQPKETAVANSVDTSTTKPEPENEGVTVSYLS